MNTLKWKNRFSLLSILLSILSGFLLFAGAICLTDGQTQFAHAQTNVEISKEIEAEYAFGDEFIIPDCVFERAGESANGVASLQFPDGKEISKKTVTLNQSGKYVLRYIATIANKVYTKEYTFTVHGRLADYANGKTSMEYGVCTDFGANSEGLLVKIANGDALTFNHVFEMSELTMATKLLEGFIVPTTQGSADFARMVFTFTDVEDPSVQLVYFGNFHDDSNAYGLTFFTAAGNGQIHCGLEHVGKLHVGSTLGCMVPHSFMAMDTGLYYGAQKPTPAAPDSKTFCISYDGKTNQAWAGGKIISDLDDSNYYDALWFGFPSGKAKLTVSALNYNNATANICFTSILGVDLSAESYVDKDAPVITIEKDYDVMPSAVVGGTYPVPAAYAIDQMNGVCDVNVSVWYNYGAADAKMVDINDSRFKVSKVGAYAIVYEAADFNGNVAREVLWVRAYLPQYVEKLSVKIDENYPTQLDVGALQTLPEVTVSGGSGNRTVTYSITKGKESCDIIDGIFSLPNAGEWTLTCTVADDVGGLAIDVCTLTGVISDKPIIVDEPNFPIAYISGATYPLPMLYAYDYKSGTKEQKVCNVTIEYNGKTSEYKAGDMFTPTADNHLDKLKIIYTCDGEMMLIREIPVLIVFEKERIPGGADRYRDVVRTEKYFYTKDNVTFTNNVTLGDISGLQMTANEDTESARATFANPQTANNFSLDFWTVPNLSKFSQLNITLFDSVNREISIKASLIKDDGQTILMVGDTVLSMSLDFDGANSASYNVGFSGSKFVVNSTTSIAVKTMENGEAFNGFPSNRIYFEIEMQNAEAGAAVFLNKICSINVNNTQDTTGPFLATAETVITNAFKDSVYTLQKIIACDVLSPNVEAYVTVVGPDGEVVNSLDGVALYNADATKEHQIKLSQYGEYYVSIVAKEGGSWKYSNESYYDYVITVVDGEAPTITFKENFKTNLKVGDTLVIPAYTLSDNFTKAEDLAVMTMIINPKGMPIHLYDNENGVCCEYAGVYKVMIYVYDTMGNLTTFETSVTVK